MARQMPALRACSRLADRDRELRALFSAGTVKHVSDIVEPGGGLGGSDRLFEAKQGGGLTESPCTPAAPAHSDSTTAQGISHAIVMTDAASNIHPRGVEGTLKPEPPMKLVLQRRAA